MDPLPIMSASERAELEREAGRVFTSDQQAHEYRIRKVQSQAVENMLGGGRNPHEGNPHEGNPQKE